MKSIVGSLFVAVVLAVAGALFWTAGKTNARVADMHKRLATLQYSSVGEEGEVVEASILAERRGLDAGAAADVRAVRATADYWQGKYTDMAPKRDQAGTVSEADPEMLFLAANAAYRTSQAGSDRADILRKMDGVIKGYAEALKTAGPGGPGGPGGNEDAAYNYEYAVRVRDGLARSKAPLAPKGSPARAALNAGRDEEEDTDLPGGPTLHGRPGGPPAKTDMSQFKIVIPKRGEERQENPDAGKNGFKGRKG
ncbi:MAG TPA: hypothetical protein VNZ26_22460 [Vicinamibacterales bacterium]|jgi:hypothetical protein|nr:hypothetical protein [Vicinamibacterales bacterium]